MEIVITKCEVYLKKERLYDYNHWTDDFGNHKELFKSLSFNEVCKKLSMMEFINYQSWKITEDNNLIDKKNETPN